VAVEDREGTDFFTHTRRCGPRPTCSRFSCARCAFSTRQHGPGRKGDATGTRRRYGKHGDPEVEGWAAAASCSGGGAPTLEGRVGGPEEFAKVTLERFRNRSSEHKLSDIAKYNEAKV